jgi:hypothetical protein
MSKIATNEQAGHRGNRVETGTTALTAADHNGGEPWTVIQVMTDTVFATLTDQSSVGDAMTGFTLTPQILTGRFTAVTLTSGRVRLLK